MNKVAFIFPGQGTQHVGMGKYFYDNFEVSRNVFEEANDILNYDLSSKIFEGSLEELSKTEITQPSIVTVSIAILEAFKSVSSIEPFCTAGLSLGEYSALVCAGAINFSESLPLVNKRAKFMAESLSSDVLYGMIAVLGLSEEKILSVIEEVKVFGILEIANYNCSGQIVVSGEVLALEKAEVLFKQNGAIRCVRLSVNSPFHTSFLKQASEEFKKELMNVNFNNELKMPIISNVTGKEFCFESFVELLSKQIMSPVLWENSVREMINMGVNIFVEIGPCKTLSGFIKKIDRKITMLNIEDKESLDKTLNVLSGV